MRVPQKYEFWKFHGLHLVLALTEDVSWNAFGASWSWRAVSRVPDIRYLLPAGLRRNMNMRFFEQPKIMFSPIRKGKADNFPILEVYQHLRFQCVLFFLPRIVPSLLFGGRSTGEPNATHYL